MTYLDEMVQAYIACALWSTSNPDSETNPDVSEFLDGDYDESDFAPETLEQARADCAQFLTLSGIEPDGVWPADQAGHDFWLTRCGHGAGFWDRDLEDWDHPKDEVRRLGQKYTHICEGMGELDLYPGDDGRLYF